MVGSYGNFQKVRRQWLSMAATEREHFLFFCRLSFSSSLELRSVPFGKDNYVSDSSFSEGEVDTCEMPWGSALITFSQCRALQDH